MPRRKAVALVDLERRKGEYLGALQEHLTLENAARAIGVSRREIFNWRQADPEFEKACSDAREMALDQLEDKAYEVALNKGGQYFEKDALLNRFFILKGHRPHYKDNYHPEVSVGRVVFTFEVPRPAGMKLLPESAAIEGEVVSAD